MSLESAGQVLCGFSIYTSLTPFSLFGVRFGCRLFEDGNDDDDVDDGNVAADDDDGFSFDIAQVKHWHRRTLIHADTFRMRNSAESSTECTSAN